MPLLTSLLCLIGLARLLGQLFAQASYPPVVGEILAGVVLGPALFKLIQPSAALGAVSDIAVFLIVLSAGLEMRLSDIARTLHGRGLRLAALGCVLPLLSGMLIGHLFGFDPMRAIFLGLAVSITALPVAVRILSSFKLLGSDIARYSIGAAILSDVLALLILGVILNLPAQASGTALALTIATTLGKLALLLALLVGAHRVLRRNPNLGRLAEGLAERHGTEALIGAVVVFTLALASVSELLGFHSVLGAFFGALIIDKTLFTERRYAEIEKSVGAITNGFLAPIFFAYLGLKFDFGTMHSIPFAAGLILISIFSKIFAGWIGGRLVGLSRSESLGVGIMLNGRGVMCLVIVGIAYEHHFINQGLFSTLVLMSVVTTLLTPLLFRRFVYPRLQPEF